MQLPSIFTCKFSGAAKVLLGLFGGGLSTTPGKPFCPGAIPIAPGNPAGIKPAFIITPAIPAFPAFPAFPALPALPLFCAGGTAATDLDFGKGITITCPAAT